MLVERSPETNRFGLVLPPSSEYLGYLSLAKPKNRPDTVDRHHLYWPRTHYLNSAIGRDFREHRFNSVWMLRTDHNNLHHDFDGVPLPPSDVMATYLDEALLLDELGVCVRAVEMIDTAIYEGRVKRQPKTEEHRQHKLEAIRLSIEKVNRLEVLPDYIAQLAIYQLAPLVEAGLVAA